MSAAILMLLSLLSPVVAAAKAPATVEPATPAAVPAKAAAPPEKAAAAARVWTNDDVQALESTGSLSIVGQVETAQTGTPAAAPEETQSGTSTTAVTQPAAPGATNAAAQPATAATTPYVKEQDPNWYEQGIESRRDQIDQIDGQIQEIQQIRATGEGISGAIPLDKTAPGITPEASIEVLQDQKNHLEAEIGDMQDLAQTNYIERNVWR